MTDPCPVPLTGPPPWTRSAVPGWSYDWCSRPAGLPLPAWWLLLLFHVAAAAAFIALTFVVLRANFGGYLAEWFRPRLYANTRPLRPPERW